MGTKAGYPPPDLILEVREEMMRLMTASIQTMAASCAEACIQQVWTACLTCLAAQANEQEPLPRNSAPDAASRELPFEDSRSVVSIADTTISDLPEPLSPPSSAAKFTVVQGWAPTDVALCSDVDEEELHSQRSKLYRFFQGEWTECGLGDAKLLKHKESGKVRFMLRNHTTSKIVSNHYVIDITAASGSDKCCDLQPNAGSDKCWVWSAYDSSDDEQGGFSTQLALKFASGEMAIKFKDAFDDAKAHNARVMEAISASAAAAASSAAAAELADAEVLEAISASAAAVASSASTAEIAGAEVFEMATTLPAAPAAASSSASAEHAGDAEVLERTPILPLAPAAVVPSASVENAEVAEASALAAIRADVSSFPAATDGDDPNEVAHSAIAASAEEPVPQHMQNPPSHPPQVMSLDITSQLDERIGVLASDGLGINVGSPSYHSVSDLDALDCIANVEQEEFPADVDEEVEALRRVVTSLAEHLTTLAAEVDAAEKLASVDGSSTEAQTRGLDFFSLDESSASRASASSSSRPYVGKPKQQVDAGLKGYDGVSVEDLSSLFDERRRFEEWFEQAMRDAAVLLERRDHFLRLASARPDAVAGHGECDAARAVAAGGDFDLIREPGTAVS